MWAFNLILEGNTREVMYYQNLNLKSVVSPVKSERLINDLKAANYDPLEVKFLENGFKQGFDIGYQGPKNRTSTAENIPFTVGDKIELWNKLMKEIKLKRVAGPFNNIPFESYIQSPIGLVPKASDQTHLIFHLFYDCQRDQLRILEPFHTKETCSVKYKDIDYAIQAYLHVCDQADRGNPRGNENSKHFLGNKWRNKFEYHKSKNRTVYAGKSDLKSAFRMIRLSSDSWPWLVMKAKDPITNEWKFFVDKCLPFGASISCALFQRFSNALCYLFEHKTNTQGTGHQLLR